MASDYINRGYLSEEELDLIPGVPFSGKIPDKKCAVIECPQEIPCDPCQSACPFGAITLNGEHMTCLPCIEPEKCRGCGNCIPACPGMAIFVVDPNYAEGLCEISLCYEFLPLPVKGDRVDVTDRSGNRLCDGVITGVRNMSKFDRSAIVSVACPREYAMSARAFIRKEL
ncbi:MAG: 4Fe-4S binding protein [Clostridia bacterium]|nr:4Fe-4S binding protein [Clostridia bacterium]